MRISNPFRYQFLQPARSASAILKLWFGKRYFILKAKSATQSVNAVSMEIDRRMRLGCAEDHIYHKVVLYIRKARITLFEVEVMFESDKPLELLKREQIELIQAKADDNCLNNVFEAYIPNWVSADVVRRFDKWKNTLKPKTTKKNVATKNDKAVPTGRSGRKSPSVSNGVGRGPSVGSKKKNTGAV